MLKLFFALICVLTFHFSMASCQENNWILYAGKLNTDQFFFNCKNTVKGKTIFLVWTKNILTPETQELNEKNSKTITDEKYIPYDEVRARQFVNFEERKYKYIAFYCYLKGDLVNYSKLTNKGTWKKIIPGSVLDEELIALKKYFHITD